MSYKAKIAIMLAVLVWASAFVAIRIGLDSYSPEGLALLRFIIASVCMWLAYITLPNKGKTRWRDVIGLMAVGGFTIGTYNLFLNYGEMAISSGIASFITSQSPIITAFLSFLFLSEELTPIRIAGFVTSVLGTVLMTLGQPHDFHWGISLIFLLLATFAGSLYSLLQKPFMQRCHAIEATTYIIWGSTLFLLIYFPYLKHDLFTQTSFHSTYAVIYLGVFPAALGYLAWSYALAEIPVTRAMSFLYFMPFIATFLGWLILGEIPAVISLVGGILAIGGVWLVNHSYKRKTIETSATIATSTLNR